MIFGARRNSLIGSGDKYRGYTAILRTNWVTAENRVLRKGLPRIGLKQSASPCHSSTRMIRLRFLTTSVFWLSSVLFPFRENEKRSPRSDLTYGSFIWRYWAQKAASDGKKQTQIEQPVSHTCTTIELVSTGDHEMRHSFSALIVTSNRPTVHIALLKHLETWASIKQGRFVLELHSCAKQMKEIETRSTPGASPENNEDKALGMQQNKNQISLHFN